MRQNYLNRMLTARDPRFGKIAARMGYATRDAAPVARDPLDHDGNGKKGGSKKPEQSDDLVALRAEYERVVGKRPFMGWKADELREKIAAAKA